MAQKWSHEKAMRISWLALAFFALLCGASVIAMRNDLLASANGRLFLGFVFLLSGLMVVFHLACIGYLALGKWLEPRIAELKKRQQERS